MAEDNSEVTEARVADVSQARLPLAVVGIGVGAASLPSLQQLAAHLENGMGITVLVAVHQDDGLSVDKVLDTLGRASPLPTRIATDGQRLEPDAIYVGGQNDLIEIEDDHLRVRPAQEPRSHRGTIDSLLISIAEHAHERAVAVILAELGSDGTAGMTALKKFGGLAIAELSESSETPESSDAGPAPASAEWVGPSPVADLHLPAERIGREIVRYARSLAEAEATGADQRIDEKLEAQVKQITTILRNVTGHDFHGYKRGTFIRRVHRRIQVLQVEGVEEYIAKLRADPQEVRNLFQDLLIGVTRFFRDPAEFDALERELPRLFEGKGPEDTFRVWVLGCATGEEAYSIAILLREHMATLSRPPEVQIFATDLDSRALGLARAGRYADTISQHIRPDRLARWFVREGNTYCVVKELREICIFSPHNIVKDAPFSRIDILSCRNLLIYLNSDLQNRVIPLFHFALKPGGLLFLGSSENVTRHPKLFVPVDRKNRLFKRQETATRLVPDFPLTPRIRSSALPELDPPPPGPKLTQAISRQAETIAERYAPAFVVVDGHGDVLHFSGRTGRYIEPSPGSPTLNLANLAHRDLRLDVRSAIARAVETQERVEVPRLILRQDDRSFGVTIVVEPISGGDTSAFVVVFQDLGELSADTAYDGERTSVDEHVSRLEAELRVTREPLQATIEEQESTNEELKSSNEEYQSINEEMQSANEELETSKEELQSVNEELQTVNGELAHRVSELGRINSDLKNLLESTQIATVFFDNDLRVRNFTPASTDVFHLLETDVGRPLDHVVSRVSYPELQQDLRRVLKTLVPVERQVSDANGERHFAARVLPYRSVDNYINGAVVTFTNLTEVYRAQQAQRESEERFRAFVTTSSDAIYRVSPDWKQLLYLDGRDFLPSTDKPSDKWMDIYVVPEDRERLRAAIDDAVAHRKMFVLEHRVRRLDGGIAWISSRAVPFFDKEGAIVEWLGTASNVTERHEAAVALQASERRQQMLIEGLPQFLWRAAGVGRWTWASPQWHEYTGQTEAESHDLGWLERVHPEDRGAVMSEWARAAESGDFATEHRLRFAETGRYRWFKSRAAAVRDSDGNIIEWLGMSTDVDDLRQLQERQGVLVAELQHRTRNLIHVVRALAERTLESAASLSDFEERFSLRLAALSRVQGLLSHLSAGERVTFGGLIRSELSALGAIDGDGRGPKVTLDGESDVGLRSASLQIFALALHELATNAVKYGALSSAAANGHLTVRWRVDRAGNPGHRLTVEWKETGVDMAHANDTPKGGGYGRELIEQALRYQLGAETTYLLGREGIHCTIIVPMNEEEPRRGLSS